MQKDVIASGKRFHTVFINLERDGERRAYMIEQLGALGLPSERVEGVSGIELPPEIHPYFFDENGSLRCTLSPGEIGCYATHLSIFRGVATGTLPHPLLVLEDDIILPSDFQNMIYKTLDHLPNEWDIVRFPLCEIKGTTKFLADLGNGRALVRYWKIPAGTHCYLINKSGAQKLATLLPQRFPIDVELCRPWMHGLNTFGVFPEVVLPSNFPSTIGAMGGAKANRPKLVPRFDQPGFIVKRTQFLVTTFGRVSFLVHWFINNVNHARRRIGLKRLESRMLGF